MDTKKAGLRILDVYTGSWILIFPSRIQGQKDPGSGSASKNFSIFNPKNCFLALGKWSGMFIPDPDPQRWKKSDNKFMFPASFFVVVGSWTEKIRILDKHSESAILLPSNKLHSYRQASLVGFVHVPIWKVSNCGLPRSWTVLCPRSVYPVLLHALSYHMHEVIFFVKKLYIFSVLQISQRRRDRRVLMHR